MKDCVLLEMFCLLLTAVVTVSFNRTQITDFHGTLRPQDAFFMLFTHPTFVSNQTRAPTVFELMQFHEDKLMRKLFNKIPSQPSPDIGKEIFSHLDIYNRCFFELLKRFAEDKLLYIHQTRKIKKQLGPLAIQQDFDEEKVRRIYLYNDTDIQLLHSKLNVTRATWEKIQIFFENRFITIGPPP